MLRRLTANGQVRPLAIAWLPASCIPLHIPVGFPVQARLIQRTIDST